MKMITKIAAVMTTFTMAAPAFAGVVGTGTINLKGTIAAANAYTVTQLAAAQTLDLTTASQNFVSVGSATEASNNANGYYITVKSTNGYALKRTGGTEKINYTLKYTSTGTQGGTQSGQADSADGTSDKTIVTVSSLTAKRSATSDIQVKVVGQPDALAGTYTDDLLFSMIAP